MHILHRSIGPAVVVSAGVLATFIGLAIGGGAAEQILGDAGAFVRYGLPVAKFGVNIAAAGMLGALMLAVWAVPRDSSIYGRTLDIAGVSAMVFTLLGLASSLFSFTSITGVVLDASPSFGAKFWQFLSSVALGQSWLIAVAVGACVSVLCFAARHRIFVLLVGILAVVAVLPLAQQGHAAGTSGHNLAVSALTVHIVSAGIWLGGLAVVTLVARLGSVAAVAAIVRRYSSVALLAFVAVAASGVVSALLRIGGWENLVTPYGTLILIKSGALLALGAAGYFQRRVFIKRLSNETDSKHRRTFWLFVLVELIVLGIASGIAAALASTPNPITLESSVRLQTPAELLTGDPLPPVPEWSRFFSEWSFDIVWALVAAFGIFFYLAGVWRLRRRGDSWPMYRTVIWVAGMLLLFYTTSGGLNLYATYLFSAHMGAHMILTMAVPVLLVPGAPVTLALRAIRARRDGSTGGREWILLAVNSKIAHVLTNPIVAALLFVGSLWVFYYSPLFRWAVTDHFGHQWMTIHFIVTGYLFVQNLIGIDPVKNRPSYPLRLLLLLATMAFHAFFGLAIMSSTGLLLADWFGAMGWGTDALLDQQLGGGIAWSVGELPTLALAITVAVQWSRSDERESRRRDRHTDRVGDLELEAYNDRLKRVAAKQ